MAAPPEKLHINRPELMTWRQRYGGAFATGVMWGIYTYLWVPLLSLVAWLLGFEFAYDVMVRTGGLQALKSVVFWYALMVAGIVIVVTGWSIVNRLRFFQKERRQASEVVSDEEIGERFGLDPSELKYLRTVRIVRITHDESGRIEDLPKAGQEELSGLRRSDGAA